MASKAKLSEDSDLVAKLVVRTCRTNDSEILIKSQEPCDNRTLWVVVRSRWGLNIVKILLLVQRPFNYGLGPLNLGSIEGTMCITGLYDDFPPCGHNPCLLEQRITRFGKFVAVFSYRQDAARYLNLRRKRLGQHLPNRLGCT